MNIIATLSFIFLPLSHHATVPPVAPPAPVVQVAPAKTVAPVTHSIPAAPVTKPQAIEGPQPVGPSQTLAPLPNRCVVNWQGTTTQTDGTNTQTATSSGSFSENCTDAYAWQPPQGVTFTVTPVPSSDTVTTGQ